MLFYKESDRSLSHSPPSRHPLDIEKNKNIISASTTNKPSNIEVEAGEKNKILGDPDNKLTNQAFD